METKQVSIAPPVELLPVCDPNREAEGLTNGSGLVLIQQLRGDLKVCKESIEAYKAKVKEVEEAVAKKNAEEHERVKRLAGK